MSAVVYPLASGLLYLATALVTVVGCLAVALCWLGYRALTGATIRITVR